MLLNLKIYNPLIWVLSVVLLFTIFSCEEKSAQNKAINKSSRDYLEKKISKTDSLIQTGHYHDVINELIEFHDLALSIDTSAYVTVLFRLGTSYSNLGAYAESLLFFKEGLEMGKILKDSILALKFEANIGILYSKVKDTTKASEIFKRIISKYNKINDKEGNPINLSPVKNSLAIIYKERYSLDTALTLFNEALLNENNLVLIAGIYNNIGTIYRMKGEFQIAHQYTDTAIQIVQNLNRNDLLVFFYSNRVKIFNREGLYDKSRLCLDSIQAFYDNSYSWMVWENYNQVQIEYYSLVGDYQKALELMDVYNTKASEEQQTQKMQAFYNSLMQMESKVKNDELKALQSKNEIKSLKLQNRNALIIFAISIILLLLILIIQVIKRQQKVDQLNQSLVKKNKELLNQIPPKEIVESGLQKENKPIEIKDELRLNLLKQLSDLDTNMELLCDPDLSIDKLARHFNSNQKYLSLVINEAFHCNFNSFINEKRIKESCRLFMDEKYKPYTIEAIAEEVGFTNKATFNRAFKKYTQVTPSVFRRHCN